MEQVTVVAPTGKIEPEAGLQLTGGVVLLSGSTQFPDELGVE
jgi:hypothetical protein